MTGSGPLEGNGGRYIASAFPSQPDQSAGGKVVGALVCC